MSSPAESSQSLLRNACAFLSLIYCDRRHHVIKQTSLACSIGHAVYAIYWFIGEVQLFTEHKCPPFATFIVVAVAIGLALVQLYGVYKELLVLVIGFAAYNAFGIWYFSYGRNAWKSLCTFMLHALITATLTTHALAIHLKNSQQVRLNAPTASTA